MRTPILRNITHPTFVIKTPALCSFWPDKAAHSLKSLLARLREDRVTLVHETRFFPQGTSSTANAVGSNTG